MIRSATWAPVLATALSATLAAALPSAGCSRPVDGAAGGQAAASLAPREAIERMLELRRLGRYGEMAALVVPERRGQVQSTLMAVDEFLHANRELCRYVAQHVGAGLSQAIDQSHWGASLDVFSRHVELLHETIEDQEATVSFQVDSRLPIRRARLARVDGAWRYDPGEGYDPELPAAFLRMARGLRDALASLQSGRLTGEAVRQSPDKLFEEVRLRLSPGVKMLPAARRDGAAPASRASDAGATP